jgi:predicted nucleic acid-binding protein
MATSDKNVRAFADANILFSGAAFPRWPYEVLQHAVSGDYKLVLCPLVINQARRNLQKRFPQHIHRLEELLQLTDYELVSDPTPEDVKANQNLVSDLSDVPVALAAIAAKADYLISEDKDFTVQDETTEEVRRHLKVTLTGTFLREVMGWTSEQLEEIRHRAWSNMPKVKEEEE